MATLSTRVAANDILAPNDTNYLQTEAAALQPWRHSCVSTTTISSGYVSAAVILSVDTCLSWQSAVKMESGGSAALGWEIHKAFASHASAAVQGQQFAVLPLQGVVAVACTDPQSFNQRVDALGGAPASHAVLIWNFRDPIHPELILESPYEVFCFQSNPLQPEVITGGCYNGQIIMWDTASQEVACLLCSFASTAFDGRCCLCKLC